MKKTVILLLFLLLGATEGNACTTFCIKSRNDLVFGRNFDFPSGCGHVIVNKRNMVKTAFVRPPEKPLEWVSEYGSITFNQIGREFPYGGMNEAGLVIEQMWLDGTVYPVPDQRFGLTELQWIQYQLDNSATLEEVLASDSVVRLSTQSTAPLHFLVCDKSGNLATIEFINGQRTVHTETSMPYSALSNDSYEKSLAFVNGTLSGGQNEATPYTRSSLNRFATAARMVNEYNQEPVIDYSFAILDSVSQGTHTRWSIVYDIAHMTIYYKTQANRSVRNVTLSQFDFSCQTPCLYTNIDANMTGGLPAFETYSSEANRQLIDLVFNQVEFLKNIPVAYREGLVNYPETTRCKK